MRQRRTRSRLDELTEQHAAQREALAEKIIALVEGEWGNLGSWNSLDVDRFVSRVIPIVTGAQKMQARMVDVQIAQILTEMLGQQVSPQGLTLSDLEDFRGVSYEEVYRRPFVDVWTDLKEGKDFEEAVDSGRARLVEIVDDDMSLAYRKSASLSMSRHPQVTGYRRIVRPEMSKGGTCPLCHLASENRYHKSELLPIHTHCRCGVMPIVGKSDPGARLNAEDLGSLETPSEKPVVRNHGELGPILQIAGQHFTTEAQVA